MYDYVGDANVGWYACMVVREGKKGRKVGGVTNRRSRLLCWSKSPSQPLPLLPHSSALTVGVTTPPRSREGDEWTAIRHSINHPLPPLVATHTDRNDGDDSRRSDRHRATGRLRLSESASAVLAVSPHKATTAPCRQGTPANQSATRRHGHHRRLRRRRAPFGCRWRCSSVSA